MKIRVLLSGKHPIMLAGLKNLLDREQDLEVAAPCTGVDETLRGIREFTPDVVIVEREADGPEAGRLLARIRAACPAARLALLSHDVGVDDLAEALRLGVGGVAISEMPPSLFAQCVRTVHTGGRWVEPRTLEAALEALRRREAGARELARVLTRREIDVARAVVEGLSNRGIATRLSIAEGTVKTHLHSIYQKLQLDGRQRLAAYGRERGLAVTTGMTAADLARALHTCVPYRPQNAPDL